MYAYFTYAAISGTEIHDVTKLVIHSIFNTNLQYMYSASSFTHILSEKYRLFYEF